MERDVPVLPLETYLKNFNSHAHVERDVPVLPLETYLKNFNSHAHVERDPEMVADAPTIYISTHTLTWSVTQIDETKTRYILFQLTRSRGA